MDEIGGIGGCSIWRVGQLQFELHPDSWCRVHPCRTPTQIERAGQYFMEWLFLAVVME